MIRLWREFTLRPAGEVYTLDSLMPREEFATTPVFNEFWRPAKLRLAAAEPICWSKIGFQL